MIAIEEHLKKNKKQKSVCDESRGRFFLFAPLCSGAFFSDILCCAKSDISLLESDIVPGGRSDILFVKSSRSEYHSVATQQEYHCKALSLAKGE